MIDYLIKFASEAEAQADPVVGPFYTPADAGGPGAWRGDCVIPGVQVWDTTKDVTALDADGNPVTTHTYDAGWFCIIAAMQGNDALFNHANLILAADRDAANAGQPFLRKAAMTPAQLAVYALAPTFAGSSYPFGTPQ